MIKRNLIIICLLFLVVWNVSAGDNKRIVSLASSITKNIYLLGAESHLVGCTEYCVTNPNDSIPIVADAVSVNMEKIALLKPDIVFASDLTHPRILEGLERLGIKTERLSQPKDFEMICLQLKQLGSYTGKEALADSINQVCADRLKAISQIVKNKRAPKVFMQIGANPLFTVLNNTFMHDYIVKAGGINIAEKLDNGMVTKEFVLLNNPDIIFITAMGVLTEEEKKNWEKIKGLQAVKDDKITLFNDEICSPTPIVFVETVEKMAAIINKR